MKSQSLESFWDSYKRFEQDIKASARKTYRIWLGNPFHPSLHFKCINRGENIWSVRITLAYRALGVLEGDTVT